MKRYFLLLMLLFALVLNPRVVPGQQLTFQTDAGKQGVLTRSDIKALPHAKVKIGDSGDSTTFEGVPLKSVLDKAGIGLGESAKTARLLFAGEREILSS